MANKYRKTYPRTAKYGPAYQPCIPVSSTAYYGARFVRGAVTHGGHLLTASQLNATGQYGNPYLPSHRPSPAAYGPYQPHPTPHFYYPVYASPGPPATCPVMAHPSWNNNAQYPQQQQQQYNYQYPAGYNAYAQAQPQAQYQNAPPEIRNPFIPPPAPSQYASQNSQYDPEYDAQVAAWQATYAPQDQLDRGKKGSGKGEQGGNPNFTEVGVRQGPVAPGKQSQPTDTPANAHSDEKPNKTVVRKGGGQSWQDDSLLEWDPTQFRIMVGNLAGEVTDDSLAKAFAQYGVSKARVVRDKRTTKSKGYGFVSFTDGELGFKAAREMTGKYIGSHPVTIQRSKTDLRPVMRKDNDKGKGKGKGKQGGGGGAKNQSDPLRANTGAHIEKKPVKNPAGYKILG